METVFEQNKITTTTPTGSVVFDIENLDKDSLKVLLSYIGMECELLQDYAKSVVNDEVLSERIWQSQFNILVMKEHIQQELKIL